MRQRQEEYNEEGYEDEEGREGEGEGRGRKEE